MDTPGKRETHDGFRILKNQNEVLNSDTRWMSPCSSRYKKSDSTEGRIGMGKLQDKVAIVTGASRGIGKAIAELFAKEGAKVVCSARTLKEGEHPLEGSLETTVSAIKKAGGETTAITCDVSAESDCEKLVAETRKRYGPVDLLWTDAALTC